MIFLWSLGILASLTMVFLFYRFFFQLLAPKNTQGRPKREEEASGASRRQQIRAERKERKRLAAIEKRQQRAKMREWREQEIAARKERARLAAIKRQKELAEEKRFNNPLNVQAIWLEDMRRFHLTARGEDFRRLNEDGKRKYYALECDALQTFYSGEHESIEGFCEYLYNVMKPTLERMLEIVRQAEIDQEKVEES
jgi:hypothetical protein